MKAAAAVAAAAGPVDIEAHAAVLSARSAYFQTVLTGEWVEAAARRVELAVADAQELEDLKLLVELSYSGDYMRQDGALLPLDTQLRLGVLADSLVFVDAVDQVVESLPLELSVEGAVELFGELPPVLQEHLGMPAALEAVAG